MYVRACIHNAIEFWKIVLPYQVTCMYVCIILILCTHCLCAEHSTFMYYVTHVYIHVGVDLYLN